MAGLLDNGLYVLMVVKCFEICFLFKTCLVIDAADFSLFYR